MPLHAATIFLSAFLLFLVQPLLAKQILPWFGGAAIVWTLCMVFFQLVLLLGYAYAHWLSGRSPAKQAWIHIGLPYFLLSSTSPLVQAWFARAYPGSSPYRLFALSNLASMLALLGYPFLFEPNSSGSEQSIGWSAGYALFALLCGSLAWASRGLAPLASQTMQGQSLDTEPAPRWPTIAL